MLCENLKDYALKDIFNADEFCFYYRMAPYVTIVTERMPGWKKAKKDI